MTLKKIVNDCFTGKDGQSIDIGRLLWAVGVLTFVGLAIYALVWKGQTWDPQAYGVGLGAVLAAGGAALGMKSKTEPGGTS